MKEPRLGGVLRRIWRILFAAVFTDLRRITERNREEQRDNDQGH
jgi:hypothetical protein